MRVLAPILTAILLVWMLLPAAAEVNPEAVTAPETTQQEQDAEAFDDTAARICTSVGTTAGSIMEARQAGVPMHEMLGSVLAMEADSDADVRFRGLHIYAVESAYASGRYSTEEFQNRAIQDHENEIFALCWADRATLLQE